VRTDQSVSDASALGIDRHGTLTVQPVDIRVSTDTQDVSFVGTRAAFGAFHQDTNLMDSGGILRSAKSITDAQDLAKFRFERAVESDASLLTDRACRLIWKELDVISISRNRKGSLFRVLDAACTPKPPKWMTVDASGVCGYITIERANFLSRIHTVGLSTLLDVLRQLRSTTNECIEVERANYPIFLWLMSYLCAGRINYRLVFDSIQHSSVVTLKLEEPSAAIEQARTAFVAGTAHTVLVTWEEKLWNPVSSGFVIGARDGVS
jgi:hypothetical protein